MKEMVYGSKVAMPNNIDSDVKIEKDTVFQVQEITCMSRCTVIRTLGVNVLKKLLWDPRRSKIRDF